MLASPRAAPIVTILRSLGVAAPAVAQAPTPMQVIEAFEGVQGPIRTHRPSHPKGTCAAGFFEGTAEGAKLSVSPAFGGQRIPTIIRFGVGGGPTAADTSRSTRSLSIRFQSQAGMADRCRRKLPSSMISTSSSLVWLAVLARWLKAKRTRTDLLWPLVLA